MLVARRRLEIDRDVRLWLRQSLAKPRATLVGIDPEIATLAVDLDWSHSDPADRLIAATAIARGAPLVSKDTRLRTFPLFASSGSGGAWRRAIHRSPGRQ